MKSHFLLYTSGFLRRRIQLIKTFQYLGLLYQDQEISPDNQEMARKDGGNMFGVLCCLNVSGFGVGFFLGGGIFVCLFVGFGEGKNFKIVFSVLKAVVVFLSTSKAPEYLANHFLQKHPHKEPAEIINQKNWCQP